jgi:hypothetical protein
MSEGARILIASIIVNLALLWLFLSATRPT